MHLRRQGFIGLRGIDPESVAAGVRHIQHRSEGHDRRTLDPCDVRMPSIRLWRVVGSILDEFEGLELPCRRLNRVDAQFAKAPDRLDVFFVAELLVAEENHSVFMGGVAQELDGVGVAELDAMDNGTEVQEQWFSLNFRAAWMGRVDFSSIVVFFCTRQPTQRFTS